MPLPGNVVRAAGSQAGNGGRDGEDLGGVFFPRAGGVVGRGIDAEKTVNHRGRKERKGGRNREGGEWRIEDGEREVQSLGFKVVQIANVEFRIGSFKLYTF